MCDCIFCKIVKGEIPSMKIYEDENTLVFLDIAEDVNGHMLAIPKKHFKNILDCDIETLNALIQTVKLVSNNCVENCGYDGVNLLNIPALNEDIENRKSDVHGLRKLSFMMPYIKNEILS